jgi:unsaturated rhamnogalacturonyl hydrolase
MKRLIFALFLAFVSLTTHAQKQPNFKILSTSFKKDTVSITRFGAIPNGSNVNTIAINNAIKYISSKGGGVVVVPFGAWITGPIVLKSNVNLHLCKGALIIFTSDFAQYPLVVSSFEGSAAARCQSPITAEREENIAITGDGIMNGNGIYWRPIKKEKLTESEWKNHLQNFGGALTADKKTWYPSKAAVEAAKNKDIGKLVDGKKLSDFEGIKDFLRPNMVRISNCKRVLIEGITLENSPAWTTHIVTSSHVTVRGLKVKNPWWGTNTDAIDLESTSNVLLENCVFDTGDDGITIKSGRDEEGRKRGMPTQNVIVKNVTVYRAHGGFVVGSEMSGGVKNIYVSNCNFIGSDIGLRFKTVRGRGGLVENIYVNDINMKDIVGEAILFDMYYAAVDPIKINGENTTTPVIEKFPVTEATPQFQNFYFDNIICDGASKAVFVRGLPEMNVKNLQLSHLNMTTKEGIQIEDATNISIQSSTILASSKKPILTAVRTSNIQIDTIAIKKIHPTASKWFEKMSAVAMQIWPDSFSVKPGGKARWAYDQGVILKGIEGAWKLTGDASYINYIQHSMDYYVNEDGSILDYKGADFNLDHLNNGKLLLTLYQITGKEKYKKAIQLLKNQLDHQPKNEEGGYWHKKIYPNQMWLDGLYMGAAFYAQYASVMNDTAAYSNIAYQFALAEKHTRNTTTGLLNHAWDQSKQQKWADPQTGLSPYVWGRAMGWYGVALVDALEYFPVNHPGRKQLIEILKRYVQAVVGVQDTQSGLWLDILDVPKADKNYYEASASSMFVTTLFKAVRLGYVEEKYTTNAQRGFDGIVNKFVKEENGDLSFQGTVSVSGLGGTPYRDGSLQYYFSEPVVVNDPKGMGAFIQASVEAELATISKIGKGKSIVLDAYYNNELKKGPSGNNYHWHYNWKELSNGGFSFWGNLFMQYGASLKVLDTAPTPLSLGSKSVYIIVDPDHIKDNPTPNYMTTDQAKQIANWVKEGGVLVLMANDSSNCDLTHFNLLATQFGIRFTDRSVNMVKDNAFEVGNVVPTMQSPLGHAGLKMYLKEVSALELTSPATTIATNGTENVIAIANFGKGTVIAIGDPWLYNEYLDGRKLPIVFENVEAAKNLAQWLLSKIK